MKAYVDQRKKPGDFLLAVFSNDLLLAWQRANDENRDAFAEICSWLCDEAPSLCRGSLWKVAAWLARKEAK